MLDYLRKFINALIKHDLLPRCKNDALYRYIYPGECEKHVCSEHLAELRFFAAMKGIADELFIEELNETDRNLGIKCVMFILPTDNTNQS